MGSLSGHKNARLHIPRGFAVPAALQGLCIADISMEEIERGFAELYAVADAVAAGHLSAVTACQRHGTAARTRLGSFASNYSSL